jgi:hypothetical protein
VTPNSPTRASATSKTADVRREPALRGVAHDVAGAFGAEIEVVVPEGLCVRFDRAVEIERLRAAGDEREDAGGGVVPRPEDERLRVPAGGEEARESSDAVGVVVGVLDVGVVEEPGGHWREVVGRGQKGFEAGNGLPPA